MSYKIVADDVGVSKEINDAIVDLINKKIVSKVSVVAGVSDGFLRDNIGEDTEVGLHVRFSGTSKIIGLNLTKDVTPFKFIYLTLTNKVSIDMLVDNIEHQFNILRNQGFRVDYMDTHHHVHVIPRVLDALILCAKKVGINSIRCITIEKKYIFFYLGSLLRYGFFMQIPKLILLYLMGLWMKKKLDKAEVDYSKNLFLMPLAKGGNYEGLLKAILRKFKYRDTIAEIVSHPGFKTGLNQFDDYSKGRFIEYQSLINQGYFLSGR
jgi:predicted glycoside hydrolase/deacetylase ChbG (UPF0249 family)